MVLMAVLLWVLVALMVVLLSHLDSAFSRHLDLAVLYPVGLDSALGFLVLLLGTSFPRVELSVMFLLARLLVLPLARPLVEEAA